MCLILFAYRAHADYPLVLIANRDEYYARPTRDAHWWDDAAVFAGRDLDAGGTWLGVNQGGHLAAVTNVREPGGMRAGKRSRGDLTREYLAGDTPARDYLQAVDARSPEFAGFNLLVGNMDDLWFYSNREHAIRAIEPGVYGISNGSFDEPWPKLDSGKRELADQLTGSVDEARLMDILTDQRIAEDHELPSTGVTLDVERLLSSRFIRSPEYGTRACTVLLFDNRNRISFTEQNFPDATRQGARIHQIIRPQTPQ
jgi:uncharacterized protein with NRDE domain